MISLILPDNKRIELKESSTGVELAESLGPRLKKSALAIKINGQLFDLNTELKNESRVEIVTFNSSEGKEILRHSASHIMAQAVTELFPEAKLGVGPAIEDGFYYDFLLKKPLNPEDLEKISKRMNKIIQKNLSIRRENLPREEAISLFSSLDQSFKVELLKEIEEPEVSLYRQGEFIDLCRGPHILNTSRVRAFKLLKVAGAYWRGDEKQPMLQRIYGTVFEKQKELEEYLYRLEEAEKRDHRRLGKELDLYSIDENFGPGLILWHPKGAFIRNTIENFWREEHLKEGYEIVFTPHIAKVDLWVQSGHWDFYRENMYSPMDIEGKEYVIKPMNCLGHISIFQTKTRSYRDLPLRWAELGTVYRFERSGVLHGLLRVRGFTQDDAHIFCRPDQLEDEIVKVINFVLFMLKTFGFEKYETFLSTRPEKYTGTLDIWDKSQEALKNALERVGLEYEIDQGEGVFYGPKIDIKIKDALNRAWQCSTIQVDFNNPERFEINYAGEDNKPHQPIMIHRALLGSMERFMGCLVEHYAGAFPLWLSPTQAIIIPIADRHLDYVKSVEERLKKEGFRIEVDDRAESVAKKIRDAQLNKIPYMLVVGDREIENHQVATRTLSGGDLGPKKLDNLIIEMKEIIKERKVI